MEARENLEELERQFIKLEGNQKNKSAVKEIFRIMHTIKGNAMGLGLDAVADLSHVMEDVMSAIKDGKVELDDKLFQLLFRGNDKLTSLINAIQTGEKVSFLGIKTSLSLHLKKALESAEEEAPTKEEESQSEDKDQAQDHEEEVDDKSSTISFSDVIQIPVKKMDELMNEVGQLIIERDRLLAMSITKPLLHSDLEALKRITSDLQYSIMNSRMVQVGFLFNKFHRVLRDAAAIEGKKVQLELKGTEIEIDRNVLKVMSDSLVHLVRNAVSHGIEEDTDRVKAGKDAVGKITLSATYERDRVIITVADDGAGISAKKIRKSIVDKGLVTASMSEAMKDEEVIQYIFEAGFSNAKTVNELSGRGVGMDVVKRAVESVGGQVRIDTEEGKGTKVSLHVPVSLALKSTMLFEVNSVQYLMALSYTESIVTLSKSAIHKLGGGLTTEYRDEPIMVVFLKDILDLPHLRAISERGVLQRNYELTEEDKELEMLVVHYAGKTTGVIVDKVIQQMEIIEKPLAKPYNQIKLLSGTTILGNGSVSPVIDVAVVTDLVHKNALYWQLEEDK